MIQVLKVDLDNPGRFKTRFKDYILSIKDFIMKKHNILFDEEEIGDLIVSICRANDFNVIHKQGNKMFLNEDGVLSWVKEKLVPNTVSVRLDDEDVVRLLIFCIEITYQMCEGGTRATVTQKGFRQRRRTFESILVDQFIGKLGEIFVKKYLEGNFNVTVKLDWEISTQIERYRNDIMNAGKKISIKSSPTLTGIWAEADTGYDYGIMVKCSVPQQPILQFFIEVCGFSRLLDFAEDKIPSEDTIFKDYLEELWRRIRRYKCGEIQTALKGYICGYFKTSEYSTVKEGVKLKYLDIVREERYLVPISELKWTPQAWREFLHETGLLV